MLKKEQKVEKRRVKIGRWGRYRRQQETNPLVYLTDPQKSSLNNSPTQILARPCIYHCDIINIEILKKLNIQIDWHSDSVVSCRYGNLPNLLPKRKPYTYHTA